MIDKETLRTARRTVERNGYTVLPPREREESDFIRFRNRRDFERDERFSRRERPVERNRDMDRPRFRPLRSRNDEPMERPIRRPEPRQMNDDEKLGAALRTAEENGFTVRKMTKLDQAKQVAKENGFDVRKINNEPNPRAAKIDEPVQNRRPLIRPKANVAPQNANEAPVNDGIRTRTAPDVEIKKDYSDDYMDRAAKFFGDEDE